MPYDPYSGCYYQEPYGIPGYDEWKLRSPYDDYEEPEECRHEEYEIDWEGRAECQSCGDHWWPKAEEVRTYRSAQLRLEQWERRERSWYMRAWRWLTVRRQRIVPDDDIPF